MVDTFPSSDHDALVTLMTEVRGLREDFRQLKDSSLDRIKVLEKEKVAVAEAERIADELKKNHADHEGRLKAVEPYLPMLKSIADEREVQRTRLPELFWKTVVPWLITSGSLGYIIFRSVRDG